MNSTPSSRRFAVSVLTVAHKTVYVGGRPKDGGQRQPLAFYHTAVEDVEQPPAYCVTNVYQTEGPSPGGELIVPIEQV
jgi:hypothetical protein